MNYLVNRSINNSQRRYNIQMMPLVYLCAYKASSRAFEVEHLIKQKLELEVTQA